jgi:hypothetical protein
MARQRQVIETITCDVCGRETEDATGVTLGWGRDQWELDLCPTDNEKLSTQFDRWIENARRVRATRSAARRAGSSDDWDYLETLGFKRHRGRRTQEEIEALSRRR